MRRNNDYCLQQLLKSSSESTVDEPTPKFINGYVSENSKYKYIVEDDQGVNSDCSSLSDLEQLPSLSDLEQLPTTSQTSMMIDELYAYIRPKILKNIDLYSELYNGDPLFKGRKIVHEIVKGFTKQHKIRPYLRKYNIGPMPFDYTTPTRVRTSSSSSSTSHSLKFIMVDHLIVSSSDSEEEDLIHTFHFSDSEEDDEEIASIFPHTHNNGRVQDDRRAGCFYMRFLGKKFN